jgi:hypothetical protein
MQRQQPKYDIWDARVIDSMADLRVLISERTSVGPDIRDRKARGRSKHYAMAACPLCLEIAKHTGKPQAGRLYVDFDAGEWRCATCHHSGGAIKWVMLWDENPKLPYDHACDRLCERFGIAYDDVKAVGRQLSRNAARRVRYAVGKSTAPASAM